MKTHAQLSREILKYIFTTMAIDEEWSVRESDGFTWWGHRFAQRVWTEPFEWPNIGPVVRLYAQTDMLCGVPHTVDTIRRLDMLNKGASLSVLFGIGKQPA